MKIAASILCIPMLAGCTKQEADIPVYESVTAEIRSIEVSVGSAGVVEPLATVEVKSKASGEVLELLVETGDSVSQGELLVRIDPRTVRNRFAQSEAELKAALSRRVIAESQMVRAESLVKQGTLTETDYEQAVLDLANAEAQVVTAQVNVENARIAVDDTEIRAPVAGTVIEKPVEKGQVISSPTQDVGGGTLLLKMADLGAVQIRALVDETDIGKVRPGMPASVVVAAYPNQPFAGKVVKVEPQAVVDQNVTMFAVPISIQNPEGLLKPGMNAEVEVSVARRTDVVTVPVMALRTDRDIPSSAGILGISESDLRQRLRATEQQDPGTQDPGTQDTITTGTEKAIRVGGRSVTLPPGVSAEAFRQLMEKRREGGNLSDDERRTLRSGFRNAGGAPGGESEPLADYRFGGDFWLVVDDDEPRVIKVRAGLTDLDRVEIVSGLAAGDKVLVLPSAHLVETQKRLQSFINRRVGGVPGIQSR